MNSEDYENSIQSLQIEISLPVLGKLQFFCRKNDIILSDAIEAILQHFVQETKETQRGLVKWIPEVRDAPKDPTLSEPENGIQRLQIGTEATVWRKLQHFCGKYDLTPSDAVEAMLQRFVQEKEEVQRELAGLVEQEQALREQALEQALSTLEKEKLAEAKSAYQYARGQAWRRWHSPAALRGYLLVLIAVVVIMVRYSKSMISFYSTDLLGLVVIGVVIWLGKRYVKDIDVLADAKSQYSSLRSEKGLSPFPRGLIPTEPRTFSERVFESIIKQPFNAAIIVFVLGAAIIIWVLRVTHLLLAHHSGEYDW